jgi:hypothetical protein
MPFDYTSGNPDNLAGGGPARMIDIQGPFYDLRTWLNSATGGGGGTSSASGVLAAAQILDVGLLNQRRAGRQLTNADFTSLGLSVPLGLWNLGDLTDVSGNGRVLSNKGSVTFAGGINGVATTAAQFTGSTGQALYIADAGANDPFRIRTGSWGCWFRTAKRGVSQYARVQVSIATAVSVSWAWLNHDHCCNATNVCVSIDGFNGLAPLAVSVTCVMTAGISLVAHLPTGQRFAALCGWRARGYARGQRPLFATRRIATGQRRRLTAPTPGRPPAVPALRPR